MPTFDKHKSAGRVTCLGIGPSGSGKTGSIAALANAGYRCCIADIDNGLDILGSYLTEEAKKRVHFVTLQEKLSALSGTAEFKGALPGVMVKPKVPKVFPRLMKLLDHWQDDEEDLGSTTEWGPDTFLILDSLTSLGDAALRYTTYVNQHDYPWEGDYGHAMGRQQNVVEKLVSDDLACNIYITSHIKMIGENVQVGTPGTAYPSALGKMLPPQIPRFFNTTIGFRTVGQGKREIKTRSYPYLDLKTSAPKYLKESYDLDWGLLEVVETIKLTHQGKTEKEIAKHVEEVKKKGLKF